MAIPVPDWDESLFGCFDDCDSCMTGYFCPAMLFGRNAVKIDGTSCALMCCAYSILQECCLCWIPHCMKRGDLRRRFGLPEDQFEDFLVTFFCSPCALCQEARFLERRANLNIIVVAPAPIMVQPHPHY